MTDSTLRPRGVVDGRALIKKSPSAPALVRAAGILVVFVTLVHPDPLLAPGVIAPTGRDAPPQLAALGAQPVLPRIIHVETQNPAAADTNPGTDALPLKTINRAAEIAAGYNADGTPVTVLIHPGTYREAVSVPPGGSSAPLTFQATARGKAVISGSDLWKGWARSGDKGVFAHAWPYSWGLAPIPPGWPTPQDIVRRREMVFANGRLLTQVLGHGQMHKGTFYVDEAAHTIYIWPATGAGPSEATVEVAVRDVLFSVSGRANLTIRGLMFEHAATALDGSAVLLNATAGVLVEDAKFQWNNWGGLAIDASRNGTVRRSIGSHNGGRGMSDWKNKNLRYEDNDTSFNNWRGSWGQFEGWTTAGIKSLRLHGGVFRRHRAVGNRASGFWLDFDNQNVVIEDGYWCDNLGGAFIEGSQGPITVARTIICANTTAGLAISVSQNVVLRDSVLYGNGPHEQLAVNDLVSGTVDNWETGQTLTLRTQSWTLCGNAFVGLDPGQFLVSLPDWDFFRNTLRSSRNVYWSPRGHNAVWLRTSHLTGRALDLAGWQKASGQDADSAFTDPRFTDPGRRNFTPLPGSPWRKC